MESSCRSSRSTPPRDSAETHGTPFCSRRVSRVGISIPLASIPTPTQWPSWRPRQRLARQDPDAILQDFGAFIVPDLLGMYGSLLAKTWKTLDVIENTEDTIHRIVRIRNPGAKPPELRCERSSAEEVVIHYTSARKMCGLGKGIVLGLAKHYGEAISIGESSCMLKGQQECTILVRLQEA
jgi:hypothetical protein